MEIHSMMFYSNTRSAWHHFFIEINRVSKFCTTYMCILFPALFWCVKAAKKKTYRKYTWKMHVLSTQVSLEIRVYCSGSILCRLNTALCCNITNVAMEVVKKGNVCKPVSFCKPTGATVKICISWKEMMLNTFFLWCCSIYKPLYNSSSANSYSSQFLMCFQLGKGKKFLPVPPAVAFLPQEQRIGYIEIQHAQSFFLLTSMVGRVSWDTHIQIR